MKTTRSPFGVTHSSQLKPATFALLFLLAFGGWAASAASSGNSWKQLIKRVQESFRISGSNLISVKPVSAAKSALAPTAPMAAFTAGNLTVFQADSASANNTTFTIVELNPNTAAQTPTNTIPISGVGANALRTSGSATSTGYLARTDDATLLSFDAHNSTTTGVNANTLTARGVGTLNAAGTFALATTYTGTSGNQARGATSLNNTNWFIADQGGIYTNGATAASPASNVRSIKSFGGTVYVLQQSSTVTNIVVSTVSAPSGGTITGLPGLTNNSSAQDFYLISSGNNGAAFDVLYITTNTSATVGSILKFSLVAGNWTANGSYTTNFGGFGLAAADNGNGALLYVSSGNGATAANNVIRLADTAGYNATINISTPSNVTLYTAPAGNTVKGIAFAPVAAVADTAPTVSSTSPTDLATNVPTNSTITLNFSEAVNLTASAVTLECPSGSPQTFTGLPASTTNVTLTPSAALPVSTVCTVTVVANQVTDTDANDPPDNMAANYAFSFTTAAAPNTNPTIAENTATPFINLPASSPGFLSGVISDPTDPGATLGVDFTVGDAETAAGSLTVTATSSNAAVVPNNVANLVFSGAGANRNLKIVPVGVGYTTITVTVTDAGSLAATYTISYAASAASGQPSTTRFHTGASDASTAVALDANYMFVADDEDQVIRLYHRQNSGLPVNTVNFTPTNGAGDPPLGLTQLDGGVPREVDIEASTRVGNRIYWLASHSNASNGNQRPNRYRLFATDISGSGASATLNYVGRYDGLRTDLLNWDSTNAHGLGANYYGLVASTTTGVIPEAAGGNGFNIEGLVMAPGSTTTAYVCFRAPISPASNRTKALIVPVTNFDTLVSANPSAGPATFGAPIELDLGGRGIRSIDKNAANEYLIVAGPHDTATGVAPSDFRLFTWTGNPANAPALRTANLTALNVDGSFEGIAEIPASLSAATQLQLIVDNGDTIWYADGIIAKDLAENNFTKFRSELVTLGTVVCPTITVTAPGTNTGTVGMAFTATFTQTGATGGVTFTTASTLPTGITLSTGGVLSGTPTQSGSFPITVVATDSNNCMGSSVGYTLTISCPMTIVNPANLSGGVVGTPYSETITPSGGSSANYTYSFIGTLPPDLTLSPGPATTASLSGNPTTGGNYSFTIIATDANGCTGTRAYAVTINQAPALISANTTTFTVNTPSSFTVTTSGFPTVTTITQSGALPASVMFTDNGNGTATLSGTPQVGTNGSYPLLFTASNGIAPNATQNFTLVVSGLVCPTTLTVNDLGDTPDANVGDGVCKDTANKCTLRAAVMEANAIPACAPLTINFSVTGVINLATVLPDLNHPNLTITGPGANQLTVQRSTAGGTLEFRIFTINSGKTVNVTGLTLTNGKMPGQPGGAIYNAGTLGLSGMVLSGNTAVGRAGGGIANFGNLTINLSTISGNTALFDGGIVTVLGQVMITDSTISGNTSTGGQSGALKNQDGLVTLTNCTLAGNGGTAAVINDATNGKTASVTLTNCTVTDGELHSFAFVGATSAVINLKNTLLSHTSTTLSTSGTNASIVSQGHNLANDDGGGFLTGGGDQINTNPLLAALGNYGGPTQTRALLPGSPAIDKGGAGVSTDQRGQARPFDIPGITNASSGNAADIGAFEVQCAAISLTGLPGGVVGTPYVSGNIASGGTAPYTLSVTAGALPPGVVISGNGLTGTPTQTGTFNFTLLATDAYGCQNSQSYTVSIVCPTITLTPATLANGVQGTAYNQTLTATPAGGNYTFAVTTNVLPPGLTLNPATGVLSGTPTAAGNYTFVITATGWGGCTKAQSYNILITGTCATITVNPATLPGGTLGVAYNQTVTATGGVAPYTFAVTQGALPAGLSLNATTGEITGAPTATGFVSFRITATGTGGCTGSRNYVVSVACGTLTFAPAGPALPAGVKGVAYTQTLTVTPGTGHTFSLQTGSLPPGYTLSAAGVLSGVTSQTGTWTFTVRALAGSCQATKQYTLTITGAQAALAQTADYDGDGRSDFAVWSGQGTWRLTLSNGGANRSAQTASWGQAGDVSLLGDYDGDGKTDLAVFRPANGTWFVKRSGDGSALVKAWGVASDVPVPGDYDGDGKTDIAIWRGATGVWFILRSSDGQTEMQTWGAGYAPYNDVPVAGDYDGDGTTDLAVFRRATGTWHVKRSSDGQVTAKAWGLGTDVPVAADYDGDGQTDCAVWRGTSWYIWQSQTRTARVTEWGASYAPYFDQAQPGDYDGDGQADVAVWRAADQTWYVRCSHDGSTLTQTQGQADDKPVRGNY